MERYNQIFQERQIKKNQMLHRENLKILHNTFYKGDFYRFGNNESKNPTTGKIVNIFTYQGSKQYR